MKKKFLNFCDRLSAYAFFVSGAALMLMMTSEFLNIMGRQLYKPLPCSLEFSESMMIFVIFLSVPFVAREFGHTNVSILTRHLPGRYQLLLDTLGHLMGLVVFSILGWGGWKIAMTSVLQLEMRIGVFRFPIWPARLIFAVALTIFVLQCLSNVIKLWDAARQEK